MKVVFDLGTISSSNSQTTHNISIVSGLIRNDPNLDITRRKGDLGQIFLQSIIVLCNDHANEGSEGIPKF